jgi:hypothetical protein
VSPADPHYRYDLQLSAADLITLRNGSPVLKEHQTPRVTVFVAGLGSAFNSISRDTPGTVILTLRESELVALESGADVYGRDWRLQPPLAPSKQTPARLKPPRTFTDRAAEALAIAAFHLVESGRIDSRSPLADALLSWADCRFSVTDGSGIAKLREIAGEVPKPVAVPSETEVLLQELLTLAGHLNSPALDDLKDRARNLLVTLRAKDPNRATQ